MVSFPKAYFNEEDEKLGLLVHHLKLKKGDVGKYVIMPGDPKRCVAIASKFENAKLIADFREYVTYTGYLDGVRVSCTSHGIGGPSTAIAVEELIKVGADTFIRVGTSGGMANNVFPGDIVIVNGTIKLDGTPHNYIPREFPAVANFDVLEALIEGAKKTNAKYHVGVIQCKDAFYGQDNPDNMAVGYELKNKWNAFIKAGALASEMESSTLFSVAANKNKRAGAVMLVLRNQEIDSKEFKVSPNDETALNAVIEGLRILIKADNEKL